MEAHKADPVLHDFVQGRRIPPDATSANQEPAMMLGTLYADTVRGGKTCASTDPADYVRVSLLDYKIISDRCQVQSWSKPITRFDQFVDGKTANNLTVLIGSGTFNAEYKYQISYVDAAGALFASPRACIDLNDLKKASIPARTCSLHWIKGAVLTLLTWQAFAKVDISGSVAYGAIVKVGTDTMGSVGSTTVVPVLSVDTVDATSWFRKDEEFVVANPVEMNDANKNRIEGMLDRHQTTKSVTDVRNESLLE